MCLHKNVNITTEHLSCAPELWNLDKKRYSPLFLTEHGDTYVMQLENNSSCSCHHGLICNYSIQRRLVAYLNIWSSSEKM